MAKKHLDPNYLDPDYEPVVNESGNTPFATMLASRMQRRSLIKGGVGAALATVMGGALIGCGSDNEDAAAGTGDSDPDPGTTDGTQLGFAAVAVSTANRVLVPEGYSAKAFVPWGTPLSGSLPEYRADGSNTGREQEHQLGMHHDGMHFFPIDLKAGGKSSDEGLLVMNHEYINQDALHPAGATYVGRLRPADEVRKEVAAHGVSVIHIKKSTDGEWSIVHGSAFNRRITGGTEMDIRGPARGFDKLVTRFSPDATRTRGTLNNCSMGATPWGTYLAAEENWHGYFANSDATQPKEQTRHGVGSSTRYDWEKAEGMADEYVRFDVSTLAASAAEDYRNETNTFGYMVEIDPFVPESRPQKRTALGRFGHEGVIFAPAIEGEPLVCYSGDDSRFEYIYKFVSSQPYRAATAGGHLLDDGTLYVARFNDDGSGEWLPLTLDDAGFVASMNAAVARGVVGNVVFDAPFSSQADLLVNTRLAADIAGATPMDRPEWGAVDPNSGEVYFTLTNNSRRQQDDVNAANPQGPNPWGHIIRWTEEGDDHAAMRFEWNIFVFAGTAGKETVADGQTVVKLDEDNLFNSPDGLWFDYNGRLWIQTDGSDAAPFQNNMMLAADPKSRDIRRFFVGPVGCEVTGVVTTPDCRTMFVNIQHPKANWPDASESRPRDATVIVTRDDGGVIGS